MAATPMLRSQFPDFYLEDALPFLEWVLDEEHRAYQPVYEKVFNVKSMSNSITQSSQLSALPAAILTGEGEQIPTVAVKQGFAKTYLALKYGLMVAHSQEMLDDKDKYDTMAKNAAKLARAFNSTCEIVSAAILNGGFSDTGPDGKSLFATDHPLLYPGAGTGSNLLATPADMSATSIKALLTLMNKTVDTAGNPVEIKGKTLICSLDDEHLANELLDAEFLVDTSNNSVNAPNVVKSKYGLVPQAWARLTDPDAFFIAAAKDDHELAFYWRKPPTTDSDIDFKTEVLLQKICGRFSVGYSDWRGIVGTPGV